MDNIMDLVLFDSYDGQASLSVAIENETVWLTLDQLAELFGRRGDRGRFYVSFFEGIQNFFVESRGGRREDFNGVLRHLVGEGDSIRQLSRLTGISKK